MAGLIGQVLDEKYRIERQLGKGGMGAVFLATHLGTERPVALKVIAPQYMKREEFVERFRREAKAAGRLQHPHVVDVTDFGFARLDAGRVAYLVMEHLDGCTLAEILAEEPQLPTAWVVDIMEQICSAVDEAHRLGIIHRDLKPDNIWLEPNRRGGYTVKVLDFGLAKLADAAPDESPAPVEGEGLPSEIETLYFAPGENLLPQASASDSVPAIVESSLSESVTQIQVPEPAGTAARMRLADLEEGETKIQPPVRETEAHQAAHHTGKDSLPAQTASTDGLTRAGSILGTPLYMSPEQCRGEALDARSDIYSLGVIAYRMFCGQTPFAGEAQTVMRLHMEEPPPPLKERNPKIRRKVSGLVMSALAKDPAARPASAAAFASALRANSEGAGTLLRRALVLYSEHLPAFLLTSIIASSPMIVLLLLDLGNRAFQYTGTVSRSPGAVASAVIGLLYLIASFITGALLSGLTTRQVTQLLVTPLRPMRFRPALATLRKRLRPFVTTTLVVNLIYVFGLILFIVPGLIALMNYALVPSVVMMEGKSGRKAMARSKELTRRARRTVIAILFIQFIVPAMLSAVIQFFTQVTLSRFGIDTGGGRESVHQIILMPFMIFITSLSAIITALLYLKARQAGGETLREVLGQFAEEEEETPRSKWQLRMRDRSSAPPARS